MVDKYIRKLDADLIRFEADIKRRLLGSKGLGQDNDDEDEDAAPPKSEKKKRKRDEKKNKRAAATDEHKQKKKRRTADAEADNSGLFDA